MTKANLHSTTSAAALTVSDEPLIALYYEWQAARATLEAKLHAFSLADEGRRVAEKICPRNIEALVSANAQYDAAEAESDAADEIEEALAAKIARTPPKTIAGVMVKIQMAEFQLREDSPDRNPAGLPEITAINAMRDARRFLVRAENSAIEAVPELPSNSLATAEARIAERWQEIEASGEDIDGADEVYTLEHFICETPPASMADVAVKLRRLLDATVGIRVGRGEGDITSLAQILAYVHTITGEPTHPTRPTATGDEDGTTTAMAEDLEAQLVAGFREMIAGRDIASGELAALYAQRSAVKASANAASAASKDDEAGKLDDDCAAIEWRMIDTPAASGADMTTKLRVLRDLGGGWADKRDARMIDSLIADAERLTTPQRAASPELVALVEKERELREQVNASATDKEGQALYGEWRPVLDAAEAFTPRSLADIALMIRLSCAAHEDSDHEADTLRRTLAHIEQLAGTAQIYSPDPLIAMCAEWHRIHAELSASYNTPEVDTSCAIHDRLEALTDRITATIPATVRGFATQLAIVRQWHVEHEGVLPHHEDANFTEGGIWFEDRSGTFVHRVLGHAERFAA